MATPTCVAAACILALASCLFVIRFPCQNLDEAYIFPVDAIPTKSGYLIVDESSRARMFYAFYEAVEPQKPLAQAPIILWLQGGPGCSSMTGNFYELGPWSISPNLELRRNEFPWNRRFGVLFIDNPVGSGFSIAEADEDVPTNQEEVATHLYTALTKFFDSEPGFRDRPLFIAGESYAGKYIPALAHFIARKTNGLGHTCIEMAEEDARPVRKTKVKQPFRLDGLVIGNGLTDPETQVQTHADTAYYFGLIDENQRLYVKELARGVLEYVKTQDWYSAYEARTELMDWIVNASGLATPLDVRRSVPYHYTSNGTEFLGLFLNKQAVKVALNAEQGAHWVSCNPRVRKIMARDTMKSVKWVVEELLGKLPILLFQGHYDIKDGVASSEAWMKTLNWNAKTDFFASERKIWYVGDAVAGYWRSHNGLTHVIVLGAGHQVPADQGLHSQRMIETWIGQQLCHVDH